VELEPVVGGSAPSMGYWKKDRRLTVEARALKPTRRMMP